MTGNRTGNGSAGLGVGLCPLIVQVHSTLAVAIGPRLKSIGPTFDIVVHPSCLRLRLSLLRFLIAKRSRCAAIGSNSKNAIGAMRPNRIAAGKSASGKHEHHESAQLHGKPLWDKHSFDPQPPLVPALSGAKIATLI
jgi:hypothetical protein